MKKIGIITFHNSYNCGSMLESYAMQTVIEKRKGKAEIINFSNEGQQKLYNATFPNNSAKNIIKNTLILPYLNRIKDNNNKYEDFKNNNFKLSKRYTDIRQLNDSDYRTVIAGSDQVWNITIQDGDDAYFLPWVKNAKKVAYAPSFGSKNIQKYSDNPEKYKKYLNDFSALSVREKNGQKWIKDLCGKDAKLLVDPTLLLSQKDYEKIEDKTIKEMANYIFFYCPSFDASICKFVKKIAKKYNLKVITWSTKSYAVKGIARFGFKLADYESPSAYLTLIKNAKLVITTSFHGTIFSTIYKKNFIVAKNGGMYGDDDRVKTLLEQIGMMDRLMPYNFDDSINYLKDIDYSDYDKKITKLQQKAIKYIDDNIIR